MIHSLGSRKQNGFMDESGNKVKERSAGCRVHGSGADDASERKATCRSFRLFHS